MVNLTILAAGNSVTEMPTFKNQMQVKQESSEPAIHLL